MDSLLISPKSPRQSQHVAFLRSMAAQPYNQACSNGGTCGRINVGRSGFGSTRLVGNDAALCGL
jgi:hypothetical protein